jgi:hypothetical protein
MEIQRYKFSESDGCHLTLDVPVESTEGHVFKVIRHLSIFGEWTDSEGDTYQLAIRPDASVDYGYYGKKETGPATFSIHGRVLVPGAVFEYRGSGDDSDFFLFQRYDGDRWQAV